MTTAAIGAQHTQARTWFPGSQNVAVQLVAHTFMFGTVLGIVLDRFAFRANR